MRKEIKILLLITVVVIIAAIVGANYYRSSIQSERKPTATTANSSLVREDSPTLGAADAPAGPAGPPPTRAPTTGSGPEPGDGNQPTAEIQRSVST